MRRRRGVGLFTCEPREEKIQVLCRDETGLGAGKEKWV